MPCIWHRAPSPPIAKSVRRAAGSKALTSAAGLPRSALWTHRNTPMAATAPTVISRVSPSLLNSSPEETRASAAPAPCRTRRENAASRAGAARRPKSPARSPGDRVSRRAGAIRAIEPVTEMIAATRSEIVGCVANAPSCAPSIIMASCPAARPGMTLRPSMRRSAETSAAGFCVSRAASASAMNSRAEAISSRARWLPSMASRRRNIATRMSTTMRGRTNARIGSVQASQIRFTRRGCAAAATVSACRGRHWWPRSGGCLRSRCG